MKNKIIISILVLGSFNSCITPKYYVLKQSQFQAMDLDKCAINYIPLEDETLAGSVILNSTYKLLTEKKYTTLEGYINKLKEAGANSSDFYLAQTLLAMTDQNYSAAQNSLKRVDDKENKLLKRLLTIDLNYETKHTEGSFNFKVYLKEYQDLIDSFPDNMALKKIVAIRLRYLRYNY